MFELNRRRMLQGMGMAGVAALLPGCTGETSRAAPTRFFERIGKPIGLQLYALGEEAGADLGATFEMVRAMGYGSAELPNLYGRDPAQIRSLAEAADLPLASLHVPAVPFVPGDGLTFEAGPDEVAAAANALGVDYLVIPFPVLPQDFAVGEGEPFPVAISRAFSSVDLDHWKRVAERFNEIGGAMKERGISVAYHNHNMEFAPLEGTTPWAVLMAETDPALISVQLDIGWVAQAGADPVAILGELGSRVTSLHVKDLTLADGTSFYFGMNPTELGNGVIDWATVLPAAEAAGVEHYFVEQEPPFTMPRAEAMQKNLDYLTALEA